MFDGFTLSSHCENSTKNKVRRNQTFSVASFCYGVLSDEVGPFRREGPYLCSSAGIECMLHKNWRESEAPKLRLLLPFHIRIHLLFPFHFSLFMLFFLAMDSSVEANTFLEYLWMFKGLIVSDTKGPLQETLIRMTKNLESAALKEMNDTKMKNDRIVHDLTNRINNEEKINLQLNSMLKKKELALKKKAQDLKRSNAENGDL